MHRLVALVVGAFLLVAELGVEPLQLGVVPAAQPGQGSRGQGGDDEQPRQRRPPPRPLGTALDETGGAGEDRLAVEEAAQVVGQGQALA
jgi:hypothetical protein